MMMEATTHKESAFLTLTYSQENLPLAGSGTPTLKREHATLFLKRLRKRLEPHRIRYFLVGEYGEQTQRPHYHAAIFGLQGSALTAMRVPIRNSSSIAERIVLDAWGLGHTQTGILAKESMEYIAGYVVKKMTKWDDPRLGDREPEFSLKSNSLGSGMIEDIASELLGQDLTRMPDVPSVIRISGKLWPIGQTLKRRLRTRIGRPANTPEGVVAADMAAVREFAFNNSLSLKDVLRELHQGDADALVGRDEIRRARKTL